MRHVVGAVSMGRVGRQANRGRWSEFGVVELGDAGEEGVTRNSAESKIDGSTLLGEEAEDVPFLCTGGLRLGSDIIKKHKALVTRRVSTCNSEGRVSKVWWRLI